MYGYGPFEQPVDDAPRIGQDTPRWVRVALLVPVFLLLTWIVAETFGISHPALGWAAVGSVTLGWGAVLAGCLFHLGCKLRGRKPDG
jgi:hypothetical protein